MTSLATIFGLLPMALKLGEGSESYAPLARALLGGLALSVLLTVFLVPAAYLLVYGKETANFWDIEKPQFAIEEGPAWLKIDPATGILSGTPDAAGKIDVAITVTIDQEVRKLNDGSYTLVPAYLKSWIFAGGKHLPGLVQRRAAEAALWSKP